MTVSRKQITDILDSFDVAGNGRFADDVYRIARSAFNTSLMNGMQFQVVKLNRKWSGTLLYGQCIYEEIVDGLVNLGDLDFGLRTFTYKAKEERTPQGTITLGIYPIKPDMALYDEDTVRAGVFVSLTAHSIQ